MRIIALIILFLPNISFSQSEKEIILIMKEYTLKTENFKSHKFIDEKLNPALLQFQKMMCSDGSEMLLDTFLEMLLNSTSSVDEFRTYIFAEVFICKSDLVVNKILHKFKNKYLVQQLEFGLLNIELQKEEDLTYLKRKIVLLKRATNL